MMCRACMRTSTSQSRYWPRSANCNKPAVYVWGRITPSSIHKAEGHRLPSSLNRSLPAHKLQSVHMFGRSNMRVMGIDPGLTRTGYGVIETNGGIMRALDVGTV